MSGADELDSTCFNRKNDYEITEFDFKKCRLGILQEYFIEGLAEDVRKEIQKAIDFCANRGAIIKSISLPHTALAISTYYIIAMCEASSNLARFDGVRFGIRPDEHFENINDFYKKVRSNFGPEVKRRIILGTFALSSGYYDAYYQRACQVRRLIQADFINAFKEVDVILSPVAPTTAYKIGEKTKNPLEMYLNDIYTIPVNLAGLPAISIPCGRDFQNLPIGLQVIGNSSSESLLLSIAQAFEKSLGK